MLRKSKSRQCVELEDDSAEDLAADPTPFVDPAAHASMEELKGVVKEVFNRMTGKHEIVVRLHDMDGHTIQEIAKVIGCPSGTVKSRLFYGRQEFKSIFNSMMNGGFKNPSALVN
jgi:RNA polymerase sigma-70 factor (ECF subfamily)